MIDNNLHAEEGLMGRVVDVTEPGESVVVCGDIGPLNVSQKRNGHAREIRVR